MNEESKHENILILWASPDLDGLTASAKNAIKEGIESVGIEVKEIHLNRKNIKSCMTCKKGGYGTCFSKGTCVIKDDMQDIYDSMIKASALVFVTPVYWHDISENFKALLDRIRRIETSKNGYLQKKRYISIACAGGYGSGTVQALSHLEEILGHMGMRALDRIPVVRFNKDYMIPALKEAGKTFAKNYSSFRFNDFNFWE